MVRAEYEDYEVCHDCYFVIQTGDESILSYHYTEEEADHRSRAIWAGWEAIVDGRHGHESSDSEEESWFSSTPCECCGERLAGTRHKLTFVVMDQRS